ncbi:MAG: CPBP family intramembrane metalloprotease [Muribaculaceae bacterium]|nr:CPBP family intramembrane metalloprotease [Muribaculaceae bacterium]
MRTMKPPMRLSPAKGMIFLVCTLVVCLVMCSVIGGILSISGISLPKLRILMVLQDLLVFVVPAIATAVIATRYPARFLGIDRFPDAKVLLLTIVTIIAAIPAIDFIVMLNESIRLPESMASFETWMKEAEDAAGSTVEMLLSGKSIGSLVVSLLIIGFLTGFSEEILFRGTMQRLLTPSNASTHVAIWLTAFIFSAIHLQFYGFIPRLLIGAFFGYLLVWSESLWLPVIGHILNNSMVVISTWMVNAGYMNNRIDKLGSESASWPMALGSAILVAGLIILLRRVAISSSEKSFK